MNEVQEIRKILEDIGDESSNVERAIQHIDKLMNKWSVGANFPGGGGNHVAERAVLGELYRIRQILDS